MGFVVERYDTATTTGNSVKTGLTDGLARPKLVMYFSTVQNTTTGYGTLEAWFDLTIGFAITASLAGCDSTIDEDEAAGSTNAAGGGGSLDNNSSMATTFREEGVQALMLRGFSIPFWHAVVKTRDVDGLTLNCVDADASSYKIPLVSMFGNMRVHTGWFSTPTSAATNIEVPLSCTNAPSLIIFPNTTLLTGSEDNYFGIAPLFGVVTGTGSTEQAVVGMTIEDAQSPSDTARIGKEGSCIYQAYPVGTLQEEGVVDQIHAGGFRYNPSTTDTSRRRVRYIAIEGVRAKLVKFTTNTGTGDQTISGVGFRPQLFIPFTACSTVETVGAHAKYCIGMTDGTTQYAIWAAAEDNVATATAGRSRSSIKNDECLVICDDNGDMVSEANFKNWTDDGVTITWGVNDGNAYVGFGLFLADLPDSFVVSRRRRVM